MRRREVTMLGAAMLLASCSADPAPVPTPSPSPVYYPNALDNQIAEAAADGEKATSAALARKKAPGDECLSRWSGSEQDFVDQVQAKLTDPASFEHMATRLGDVTSTGMRPIVMKYRARDRRGAMAVEEVPAAMDPRDCHVLLLTTVEQTRRVLGR